MNTKHKETRILRCDDRGCGVPFMLIKGGMDGQDAKIRLARPERVALNPDDGSELTAPCPTHER